MRNRSRCWGFRVSELYTCQLCLTPAVMTCVGCGESYTTTEEHVACEEAGFHSPRGTGTWRPLSRPPWPEEHAWCKGRYLLDQGNRTYTIRVEGLEHWERAIRIFSNSVGKVVAWLPIPPSKV